MSARSVGVRWTIGAVSDDGWEALRLAVWGGWRVFGPGARYAICVNTVPLAEARRRAGDLPAAVRWVEATGSLPPAVREHVGANMAEGKAWKFDPLHVFPDCWELSFDNDCILWEMPGTIRAWLAAGDPERCLIAADVRAMHGAFSHLTDGEPRNAGIRGLPPCFPLERLMGEILAENPVVMTSELDEQGLQVAAISRLRPPAVVSTDEVTICSPFWPHQPHLGRFGAHFVGLNEHHLPWEYYGRPAIDCLREHWRRNREELHERVGIAPPERPAEAA